MASEEQYLDDLLKNIIGDEPPKERTMQDVMREIGVPYVPEPEPEVEPQPEAQFESQPETLNPEIDPDIIPSDPVSVSDEITDEVSSDIIPDISNDLDNISREEMSNLTFPDQDVLADMLDILDNPSSFANETAETTEEEISQMLEGVPGIIDEPAPLEEPIFAEESSSAEEPGLAEEPLLTEEPLISEDSSLAGELDPLQEDLESMLDGIEENYNLGEVPIEEPAAEAPVEEPIVENPVEEPVSQEDLEALLAGLGSDETTAGSDISNDLNSDISSDVSEELSSEDIDAMLADAEGLLNADAEAPTEEPFIDIPVEEPAAEDIPIEEPIIEEIPVEEPSVEVPVEEPASQDDLAAMLEGMGGDDPNAKMSPDDIAAMFAAAEGATTSTEEVPAEEPVEEASAEESASQDDLAAMLAGMGGDDPNAKMSPDDIAAMFAAAEGVTAAAEEAPVEEAPANESASQDDLAAMLAGMGGDDPNAKMSPDDIAAMFAAAEGANAAAEETPAEEPAEEAPAEEPASQDDLAAMLEGMDGEVEAPAEEDGVMMSSDDELLKMLGEATTAEDFVMPEDRLAKADDEAAESEGESEIESADDVDAEAPAEIDEKNLSQSDIEALMAGEPLGMPSGDSQEDLEALLAMAGGDEEDNAVGEDTPAEESQDDLEAMLAAAGESEEAVAAGEGEEAPADGDLSQDDLEAMLGGMDMEEPAGSSEEMSDVEKLEATEGSDEDLLSLLEGIDETPAEERGLDGLPDELSGVLGEEEGEEAKPKKKKFSLLSLLPFGKKKKKGEEEVQANWDDIEGEPEGEQPIEAAAEQIDDILAGIEAEGAEGEESAELNIEGETHEGTAEIPEKKKGFFAKLLSFLFDEEEEEEIPAEEVSNEDILAQIDSENAEEEAKGKKGKKGKKDKKKKGKKAEGEEGGEGSSEEGEEGGDDSKKKKKKKEKAPKEPKEPKEKEPRKVVLSKKAFIALVALCASLIAAIVICSNLLPDHADKVAARRAYFLGDYRTVYDKLHDKNLGDSDYLLYKKAETVLLLQRRVDSYKNRIKLKEPAQALDSLLEGVHLYDVLTEGDQYNVNAELEPIYQEILEILRSEYGIDHDEAVRLYSMEDSEAYTEELIRIISGGNYKIEKPVTQSLPVMDETMPDDQGDMTPPDDNMGEMPPMDQNPDEMMTPLDEDNMPEGQGTQEFEELHPLEDLLEAEEDI